jgi:ribosome-associated heat shock protein Hsp15
MIPKSGNRFSDEIMRDAKRQRIDKWLWHARMVRTRSDAAALVQAGYVRINSAKVSAPGHAVRVGDVLTLALDRSVRILKVEGFCEKRGDAPAARKLYLDLSKDVPR